MPIFKYPGSCRAKINQITSAYAVIMQFIVFSFIVSSCKTFFYSLHSPFYILLGCKYESVKFIWWNW